MTTNISDFRAYLNSFTDLAKSDRYEVLITVPTKAILADGTSLVTKYPAADTQKQSETSSSEAVKTRNIGFSFRNSKVKKRC